MRYWAILAGKLFGAGVCLWAIWVGMGALYVPPDHITRFGHSPFLHDLTWTSAVFLFNLLLNGVLFLIVLDQRYRCRECGRRLRMPVRTGSHAQLLFRPPRTEYICTYGHGTLKVPEVHLTGPENPAWQPHEDIWKELFTAGREEKR